MVFFSLFVQAAEGATFGIVPYVDPCRMGTITGIVGAGGNVGAVALNFAFLHYDYHKAYTVMGVTVIASSLLSPLISIPGYSSMLWGKKRNVDKETGQILSIKLGSEIGSERASSTSGRKSRSIS